VTTTDKETTISELVDAIKQDIIFGRLRPRERLVEEDLSARFQASRHTIRGAIGDLQRMGLVTRRPNKGAIVRDFAPDEVEEIYEMRALLQAEAVTRIALPANPDLLDELDRILTDYEAAIERRALKRVCELNNLFHHTMFAACNNRCLTEMIQRIWTETLGIRCYAIGDPELLDRAAVEHRQMVEALRAGQRGPLIQLCVDHIWPALEAYKKAHGGWQTEGQDLSERVHLKLAAQA